LRITNQNLIYRILDANFNRLREALRVVEEYYRFILADEGASVELKGMRHALTWMENTVRQSSLLEWRDTESDCFASTCRPEEMNRADLRDVLIANFKRAQEACRVIEEYSKVSTETVPVGKRAKEMRFSLYAMEKASLSFF